MRIVIDMQGAQTESRFRGIGRYTMSFAQAIIRNRGTHEVLLALNGLFPDTIEPIRAAFHGVLPQENIRVWRAAVSVSHDASQRRVVELIREAFLVSLQPDVIHVSSLFEGYLDDAVTSIGSFDRNIPVSVTLYDLIPLLNPDQYLKGKQIYGELYKQKIEHLSRASLVLAISDFSRQEGLAHLNIAEDQVVTVSTAIDGHFRPLKSSSIDDVTLKAKLGIKGPFVLYTGGSDERKNLSRLVQAFGRLKTALRQTHQLVLVGTIGKREVDALSALARVSGLSADQVLFTGYVSDDDMVCLYNLCETFVFPSWHEGFGLPALEAMACGAVVIGANATSLPEVIGSEDALFDPFDISAIAANLERALEDEGFRAAMRAHGLIQTKKFSWDRTAQLAIRAFERLPKSQQSHFTDPDDLLEPLIRTISESIGPSAKDIELRKIAYALDRSILKKAPKQFFVDISELVMRDARTGVQRVTRSILRQLLLSPPSGFVVEPVYATTDQPGYRYARRYSQGLEPTVAGAEDEVVSMRPGDIFLGLDLQHHTTRAQAKFLSDARQDGVLVFFVVYDLLPIHFPEFWPKKHGLDQVHRDWLYTICHFDGVICISRTVANELEVWLRENSPPRSRKLTIQWFHLGADVDNSIPSTGLPVEAEEFLNVLASKPSFLSVGSIEPRKGHEQTLSAFELLWQTGQDINLVLVGKQGWMVEPLVEKIRTHVEFGVRLFWLEGISDEYLKRIYSNSTCLIAASEGEGFGLPLIEAAQHDLPIIARDIPVFREVAEEHAFYFTAKQPTELADGIQDWLLLHARGLSPKSGAMRRLTWEQSARALIEICVP